VHLPGASLDPPGIHDEAGAIGVHQDVEVGSVLGQYANAHGAFAVTSAVPPGPVLLVDDVRGSGWTLTTAAGLLRDAGAGPVHPLALLSGWPAPADTGPSAGQ
jgi:hypothetical protein